MSHEDMDNILYSLYNCMKQGEEYTNLSYALTRGNLNFTFNDSSLDSSKLVSDLIKKIVTDFLTYNLYKRYIGKELSDDEKNILVDFEEIVDGEDVIKFVNDNLDKFSVIISDYFSFQKEDNNYKCMAIANVVNQNLSSAFTDLYLDYFMTSLDYDKYLLPRNIIYGLDLLEFYNNYIEDDSINRYLNNEFESKVDLYNFLNYILSNVYANLKINGSNDEFDEKIVKLTEKIDKCMKCFYDDKNFIINLVKKYKDIYNNVKWYDFRDIRDSFEVEKLDIIYKLDPSYKHPNDVIKNATSVSTIMGEIQRFLFDQVENFCNSKWENDQIIDWIINLVNGDIKLHFDYDLIFDKNDRDLYINLVKMYLVSICYECLNYKVDNLSMEEESLYNYLDNNISSYECLELFDDEVDKNIIVNNILDYFYSDTKLEVLSRKKIVDDGKYNKILKINPFMYLEYRRVFGSLLPLETSKSTEYGNLILGKISDIISYSSTISDYHDIKYEDFAQIFKNESEMLYMTNEEIAGFIVSNIYENLKLNNKLTNNENDFISLVEDEDFDIEEILLNEDYYGRLLYVFYEMNEDLFNDDKFRKLRKYNNGEKVKVLKKYDPFYDEDFEILK